MTGPQERVPAQTENADHKVDPKIDERRPEYLRIARTGIHPDVVDDHQLPILTDEKVLPDVPCVVDRPELRMSSATH